MAGGFTIDLTPLKVAQEVVKSIEFRREVSRAGAQAAVQQVDLAFRTGGSHYGDPWEPRSTSTAKALSARKRKKNGKLGKARTPKPLLVDTGTLRKSFFVSHAGGDAFSVATPVPYAKYHEYSTSKMPARPVMPIDAAGNPRGAKVETAIKRAMEARVNQLIDELSRK